MGVSVQSILKLIRRACSQLEDGVGFSPVRLKGASQPKSLPLLSSVTEGLLG